MVNSWDCDHFLFLKHSLKNASLVGLELLKVFTHEILERQQKYKQHSLGTQQ